TWHWPAASQVGWTIAAMSADASAAIGSGAAAKAAPDVAAATKDTTVALPKITNRDTISL
ncbi:hypothetical protein, partial [Parasphingorhabdus sp.]|uniref:hypothetical protein n=1 Tax=Parasphingorhabdus sp. TaxID=2709688 RepID=UPI003299EC02